MSTKCAQPIVSKSLRLPTSTLRSMTLNFSFVSSGRSLNAAAKSGEYLTLNKAYRALYRSCSQAQLFEFAGRICQRQRMNGTIARSISSADDGRRTICCLALLSQRGTKRELWPLSRSYNFNNRRAGSEPCEMNRSLLIGLTPLCHVYCQNKYQSTYFTRPSLARNMLPFRRFSTGASSLPTSFATFLSFVVEGHHHLGR
jgi:hypothetical protein